MLGIYSGLFNHISVKSDEPEIDLEPQQSQSFQEKWGWYIPLYDLCGNDLKLREDWLNTNVLEFLNQLSFLKERNNLESQQKTGKQY